MFFMENGHYLVKSAGLMAIRTNKFLSGEFRVFCGKIWSLLAMGVAMEIWR